MLQRRSHRRSLPMSPRTSPQTSRRTSSERSRRTSRSTLRPSTKSKCPKNQKWLQNPSRNQSQKPSQKLSQKLSRKLSRKLSQNLSQNLKPSQSQYADPREKPARPTPIAVARGVRPRRCVPPMATAAGIGFPVATEVPPGVPPPAGPRRRAEPTETGYRGEASPEKPRKRRAIGIVDGKKPMPHHTSIRWVFVLVLFGKLVLWEEIYVCIAVERI
mmetsp:Transcript_119758/g.244921  ORF Transcript_119758/g.244921 Transcript_119758/m.244921 type:complete len:216 (-) Transcript_119758:37-684(-)